MCVGFDPLPLTVLSCFLCKHWVLRSCSICVWIPCVVSGEVCENFLQVYILTFKVLEARPLTSWKLLRSRRFNWAQGVSKCVDCGAACSISSFVFVLEFLLVDLFECYCWTSLVTKMEVRLVNWFVGMQRSLHSLGPSDGLCLLGLWEYNWLLVFLF